MVVLGRGFALIACFSACGIAFADPAADRAAIEAAAQQWTRAFNTRDVAQMLASTSEDVVLLDPQRSPVEGHDDARDAWQSALKGANVRLANKTREITVTDDAAWRIATFQVAADDVTTSTSALEVWKRVDGRWKLHRQMSARLLSRTSLVRPNPSEPWLDAPKN